MKCPSKQRLIAAFQISEEQANLIRKICAAHSKGGEALREVIDADCPETAAYIDSMYSDPYRSHMWQTTVALHALDKVLGTYGVERIGQGRSSDGYAPPVEYLNTGDSYGTTLLYYRRGDKLEIGSWGDYVERHERRHGRFE